VVHLTMSGAPGWSPANWPLSGKLWRLAAIIHRTVRWCTGLSDEPTAARATVDHAIRGRRVARANGLLGAPDCLVCTGQCPVRQPARSCNGRLRQEWKEIAHQILVFKRARYLAILTLNQVLWLLVVEFYRITYSPPL
jgi:hypothetical protein